MRPLAIIALPEDLTLVGEILKSTGRAYRVLTGGQSLTTASMRQEFLPPWGDVLVVYDGAPGCGPAETAAPVTTLRCEEHRTPLPCSGCAADAKAAERPVRVRLDNGRPTPLDLARLRQRGD